MADLPTNFKDDILDTSVNTRRRYRVYENTDGTIELEDVTEYSQVGDEFGAGQINATNMEVNKRFDKNMIVRGLDTINAITKEGYVPDALALKEVNDSLNNIFKEYKSTEFTGTTTNASIVLGELTLPKGRYLINVYGRSYYPGEIGQLTAPWLYIDGVEYEMLFNPTMFSFDKQTNIEIQPGTSRQVEHKKVALVAYAL